MLGSYWNNLQLATGMGLNALWLALAFIVASAALLAWVPTQRRRIGRSILLFLIAAIGLLLSAALLSEGSSPDVGIYRWIRFIALLLLAIAMINVAGVLLFDVLLSAVRLRPPAIVSDLLVAIAYLAAGISLLSLIGVNLTGIVATSAVVTAVIGFSLQDTLSNIMGGMAVQLDHSIHVGDWIRVGESEGR